MTERVEPADFAPWSDGGDLSGFQWYRTLVDTVAEGVFQLDADDRIIAIDDTLLELTGYDREVIRGEHISQLVGGFGTDALGGDENGSGGDGDADSDPGSDGDGDADTDRNAGTDGDEGRDGTASDDEGGVTSTEGVIRTAAGTEIPCELRLGTVPADNGRRGTVGVVRDLESRPSEGASPAELETGESTDRPVEPAAASESGSFRSFESITAVLEGPTWAFSSSTKRSTSRGSTTRSSDTSASTRRRWSIGTNASYQMRSSPSGSAIRIDSSRRSVRPTMTTATPNDSTVT